MNGESVPADAGWRKSTASASTNCVEVAMHGGLIHVRDSKAPAAGHLSFTPAEWDAFLTGVRQEEFDRSRLEP
jgi:uncharacterized protein DUF397